MSSNLMPGSMSGMEPQEHDTRCASKCLWADDRSLDKDGECVEGHFSHDCNCDALAEMDAENEAEAMVDWLEQFRYAR